MRIQVAAVNLDDKKIDFALDGEPRRQRAKSTGTKRKGAAKEKRDGQSKSRKRDKRSGRKQKPPRDGTSSEDGKRKRRR